MSGLSLEIFKFGNDGQLQTKMSCKLVDLENRIREDHTVGQVIILYENSSDLKEIRD